MANRSFIDISLKSEVDALLREIKTVGQLEDFIENHDNLWFNPDAAVQALKNVYDRICIDRSVGNFITYITYSDGPLQKIIKYQFHIRDNRSAELYE